ncbi:MAG: hypothetical protein LBR70_01510 [Lactobacillaceae bacterium]|jgi:hypothetical protein|nr:hypothetical protein [Lactobacillaceae bacterium]
MNNEINRYNFTNGSPVYSGRLSKFNGEKLDKSKSFFIRPLTIKDCSAMEDLSVCIYENLREGQECFIHKHDREYYRDIFQGDDTDNVKFIGVFVGKHLVAMSYFRIIDNDNDLQPELPNHKLDIFSADRGVGEVVVAAFGSDSVHPDYRGNRLNTVMVDYRANYAKMLGATDFVSIIDRKNVWNMNPYFDNGFNMFASSVDPADNGKIALMHKPAVDKVVHNDNELEKMNYENLNTIDKMFYMKRIGVAYDKETSSIIFAKTSYYSDMKKHNKGSNNNMVMMMARGRRDAAGY